MQLLTSRKKLQNAVHNYALFYGIPHVFQLFYDKIVTFLCMVDGSFMVIYRVTRILTFHFTNTNW
jgi:hypothetical protein